VLSIVEAIFDEVWLSVEIEDLAFESFGGVAVVGVGLELFTLLL
jgi:hypothetical protein